MDDAFRDKITRMAWEDQATFDDIKKHTGATEAEVIEIMRDSLKTSSFRLWRNQISGHATKHRRLMQAHTYRLARQQIKERDDISL